MYDQLNNPIWSSFTNGRGAGSVRLVMEDDGNLVLYDQNKSSLWASNTAAKSVVDIVGDLVSAIVEG